MYFFTGEDPIDSLRSYALFVHIHQFFIRVHDLPFTALSLLSRFYNRRNLSPAEAAAEEKHFDFDRLYNDG